METKKIVFIDEEIFNMMYSLKCYCESRKNCAGCVIENACEDIGRKLTNDEKASISTIEIAKTSKEDYICFTTK